MKPQSEKLFQYLKEKGLLDAPDEVIQQAKREYRKKYKKEWHQHKKEAQKVVRLIFTQSEFNALSFRAKAFGLCPTHYAKQCIISNQENTDVIPHQDILQKVLQQIAMASIQSIRMRDIELKALLDEAETLLTKYLNQNH